MNVVCYFLLSYQDSINLTVFDTSKPGATHKVAQRSVVEWDSLVALSLAA
jgi:hypothetical protein